MLEELICYCCNSDCSRKELCFRYALKEDLPKEASCLYIKEHICC